jgi:hypothetical protein
MSKITIKIDAGIAKLAKLTVDFASMEQRVMHQVLEEMRHRVAFLDWKPTSFKNETEFSTIRKKEARKANKARMEALMIEMHDKKYLEVLFDLTWGINGKGENVANSGAVQFTDISTKDSGPRYTTRYSNTHNTLNTSWLLWAWANPNAAFKALRDKDAVALITAWKAKKVERDTNAAAKLADDGTQDTGTGTGTENAGGDVATVVPLPPGSLPILGEAFTAADSFKRAASALCEHHGEDEAKLLQLAELIAQVVTHAKTVIQLASEEVAEVPLTDAQMTEAALAAATTTETEEALAATG